METRVNAVPYSSLHENSATYILLVFADDIATLSRPEIAHILTETNTIQKFPTNLEHRALPSFRKESRYHNLTEKTLTTNNDYLDCKTQKSHLNNGDFTNKISLLTASSTKSSHPCSSSSSSLSSYSSSTSSCSSSSSSSSLSSSLCSSSDSDESSSIFSDVNDASSLASGRITLLSKKIKRDVNERRKTLYRLSRHKGQHYISYLKACENMVQNLKRHDLDAKRALRISKRKISTKPDKDDCVPAVVNVPVTSESSLNTTKWEQKRKFKDIILRQINFERYHTLPSALGISVYCVAHQSLYDVMYNLVTETTKNSSANESLVHTIVFLVGVFISRLSGGTWVWLGDNNYEGLKFEMHNKLFLRDLDALVLQWFRKHSLLQKVVQLAGFYLCAIAMAHFFYTALPGKVCDIRHAVLDSLPSQQMNTTTMTRTAELLRYPFLSELEMEFQSLSIDPISMEDELFLYSKVSMASFYALFGSAEAALSSVSCSLGFHSVTAAISTFLLYRLGLGLFD